MVVEMESLNSLRIRTIRLHPLPFLAKTEPKYQHFSSGLMYDGSNITQGSAVTQAGSRRLPTATARVQDRVKSCGICGGHSDTGAGFLRELRLPFPILHSIYNPTIIYHPRVVYYAQ
jgi:hypothetical protein